ncbi:MAG: hypothetical protein U0Y10_16115 [Spirosomataceae bacterium]
MQAEIRAKYNSTFSVERYQEMLQQIHQDFPNQLEFRVAETPVFVPKQLGDKIKTACESFVDVIVQPDFKAKTQQAIPANQVVPNENDHTSFLAIDFAVCRDEKGELTPQLIELQGFPSIFGFQAYVSDLYRKFFYVPDSHRNIFGGLSTTEYYATLQQMIVGDANPDEVILLEIYPEQQKTRIDFAATLRFIGVKAVCYTKIQKEGRQLFYDNKGTKTPIKRIYNRLIFDDLGNFPDLKTEFNFTDDVDVEWIGHPNWFFRISKYTMPFLKSPYVPDTRFVSEFGGDFPADLENYVLKPLFSFAGSGVKLHITAADLTSIQDPENYILQRKVNYEPVVQALDGLVKCEIRMLYIWPKGEARPTLLTNLARLSRGEMIGVRFNKDFDWVGGSTCFFEE